MPEDLSAAMPHLSRMAEAFGIPVLKLDGYEADDIIGDLARRAEADGFDEIYMVTPDKDFGQLVTEKIKNVPPLRQGDGAEIWGVDEIKAKWGIARVDQVIDMLGLCGDVSDNIPGWPSIGPKTAEKLLAKYDTVEGALEHVDELKGKQQEKVRDNADQARLSKKLAPPFNSTCRSKPTGTTSCSTRPTMKGWCPSLPRPTPARSASVSSAPTSR